MNRLTGALFSSPVNVGNPWQRPLTAVKSPSDDKGMPTINSGIAKINIESKPIHIWNDSICRATLTEKVSQYISEMIQYVGYAEVPRRLT